MAKQRGLTRFVGVRLAPAQAAKLLMLAEQAGEPGNMSAGLRLALDLAFAELPARAAADGAQCTLDASGAPVAYRCTAPEIVV